MTVATSTALNVAAVRAWLESLEPGAIFGTSHIHQACPLATYLSQTHEGRESYVDVFYYWVRDRAGRQCYAETRHLRHVPPTASATMAMRRYRARYQPAWPGSGAWHGRW
jgi:hypothetical protein